MTKVWIVEGSQGQYDEYHAWVAGVFEEEADARDWVFETKAAFEVLFPKLYEAQRAYYVAWGVDGAELLRDRIAEILVEIKAVDGRVVDDEEPKYTVTEYPVFPATFKRSEGGRDARETNCD